MENIQKEDMAWIISGTKQYFIAKNSLRSMLATFLLFIILSVLVNIFKFRYEWAILSLFPVIFVLTYGIFVGYSKKWQLRFLKQAKDKKQEVKDLQAKIDKIEEEAAKAKKLYILLLDFNK